MELKCTHVRGYIQVFFLLIVPYGIEIIFYRYFHRRKDQLLIVPYGIEISEGHRQRALRFLLIVPYGIEILELSALSPVDMTFNRTLWN